ncbi:hypothetical protein [Clostridium luticellarii]|uniref:Uncharacterized protein n=1 Tax=Clostridium luticellarii TaxID=1691940 RepID=A0A2T0BLS7_9CLOT|nr:hypothetical protein [Clostridium luticellarii]MCI1967916.1 hypothetical protein [Clostridium luticellarii]PRR84828.1 hypothetical protein CLLU_21700 [Clostridium luticellarii]
MNTTMKISADRLLLLKKLFELGDIIININESQMLLNDELKKLEHKRQKYAGDRNKFLQSKNCFVKNNTALNFIKSEDFKRLCIATYCNLHNSFSYTLCHYENLNGMWCVTSNAQETFDDNNSIMNYIRNLTGKYGFEILDLINTIGKEKYEPFDLNHFIIDESSKSLQEKIQNYYRLQLSNMVEDYNEEMKMQITFRPSVPHEACSAYRKKQVDLVEEVSKLKDELKNKLEKLIYVIPGQFIEEETLAKIQSYYLMKFQESDAGKRLNNALEFKKSEANQYIDNIENYMNIIESKNTSLADMKNKIISKYCTFLPSKYIFNEYALSYFVKYIYCEQADNIEQCINIFEHRELHEEILEQTISLEHVIDNLRDSVVNQLSKVNMELDTLVMNTRAVNENNDIQRLYLTTLEFNRKCVDFINKVKNEWNADF